MTESNSEGVPTLPSVQVIEVSAEKTYWKCSHCEIYFKSRRSLNLHLGVESITEGPTKENPYVKFPYHRNSCHLCGESFDSNQGLKQHIGKKHNLTKEAICSYCNKTFRHKYALKFHVNQVHQKSTRVNCKYCEEPFYNEYSMKKHSRKCKCRFPGNNKINE